MRRPMAACKAEGWEVASARSDRNSPVIHDMASRPLRNAPDSMCKVGLSCAPKRAFFCARKKVALFHCSSDEIFALQLNLCYTAFLCSESRKQAIAALRSVDFDTRWRLIAQYQE